MGKRKVRIISILFLFSILFFSAAAWAAEEKLAYLPLHSGYAFLGYLGAGNLTTAFRASHIFTAVILIGFLTTIVRSVTTGKFSHFITYFIIVLFLIPLFITPMSISKPAEGKEVTSGRPSSASPPVGLYWIVQFTDKLANLVANTIDITTAEAGGRFRDDPAFLFFYTKMMAENVGIQDPKLAQEFKRFTDPPAGPFYQALGSYYADHPEAKGKVSWPGAKEILPYYENIPTPAGGTQKEVWDNLVNEMYEHVKKQKPKHFENAYISKWHEARDIDMPYWKKIIYVYGLEGDPKLKEDLAKHLYFQTETDPIGRQAGAMAELQKGPLKATKELVISLVGKWRSTWLRAIISVYPLLQGILLYMALTLFPFILLMALLPFPGQQVKILLTYFLSIFWIKSWLWGTIIAVNFDKIGWQNVPWLVEELIPYAVGLIILLTPVFTYMFLFKGSMAGVAMVSGIVGGLAAGGAGAGGGAAKMGMGYAAGGVTGAAAARQKTQQAATREQQFGIKARSEGIQTGREKII